MSRIKIDKEKAKQERQKAKQARQELAWSHKVKRNYAKKNGGYWFTPGTMKYNKETKKWAMEGGTAQRILTKAEARTVVRRALALVKQALYENQNGDDMFSPQAWSDWTYHGKRSHYHDGKADDSNNTCTYGNYKKDKADHAQECIDDVWDTDGIYAMALRIEQQANAFYEALRNYMWSPYEQYDPGRQSESAYAIIVTTLYTAITGEDIGKELRFKDDEFDVIDYSEEIDADIISEDNM